MGYIGGKLPETDEDYVLDLACSYHEYLGVPRHFEGSGYISQWESLAVSRHHY